MIRFKLRSKLYYMVLMPLGFLMSLYFSHCPDVVEKYYSRGIFRLSGQLLSIFTGIFPFSLAEIIVVFLALYVITAIILLLAVFFKDKKLGRIYLKRFTVTFIAFTSIVYFLFIMLWGLNYHRLPLAVSLQMDVKPSSIDELSSLCDNLIVRANSLREGLPEDSRGVMKLSKPLQEVFNDLNRGYRVVSIDYPIFSGNYGNAKAVLLSKLMSYTGITGVYFPFTGEANVNISVPDLDIPSTAAHEMAHQRGFAREDEANYISYLICTHQPEALYQYSGVLLALIHSMNALYENNPDKYKELSLKYSDKVLRDLKDDSAYWERHEGPIDRLSSHINDAYLKSNLQENGIKSYGRMVDLLLAERRKPKL